MSESENNPKENAVDQLVTIKKYANRRLYNTASSAYVTHENLCQMVKDGIHFVVYDARTNEDITRSVLTQIIVDEESKGQNLLPVSFLRQLISFYGDSMQWLVPGYLESTMKSFTHNQDKMRQYLTEAFGGLFSFNSFETMTKQNMVMVENAMKLFTPALDKYAPFDPKILTPAATPPSDHAAAPKDGAEMSAQNLQNLQNQLAQLQQQLNLMQQATAAESAKAAPHPATPAPARKK
ncbi:MAG: polyhydroxyalkanoate synthesis repressor PhaR [Candidatus Symbiobacter sp.]|nr:polyhydroxyalkanoate synthesis repressor PhaR [Candidatus Symbiobacter sp.]